MNHQFKGIRKFSFAEIQKYTRNFSQDNDIGSGGYGKVVPCLRSLVLLLPNHLAKLKGEKGLNLDKVPYAFAIRFSNKYSIM